MLLPCLLLCSEAGDCMFQILWSPGLCGPVGFQCFEEMYLHFCTRKMDGCIPSTMVREFNACNMNPEIGIIGSNPAKQDICSSDQSILCSGVYWNIYSILKTYT
jgi:hypothetical protein